MRNIDLSLVKSLLSDSKESKEDILKFINQKYPPKKFNHAFTIAFSIDSDNDGENVTNKELLQGLINRVNDIIGEEDCDLTEACGLPFDTYENY